MQRAGSIVYWFCASTAVELILFGMWNAFAEKSGRPILILLFCFSMAAVFYLAGVWARHMARRVASQL